MARDQGVEDERRDARRHITGKNGKGIGRQFNQGATI
jgi:hypothetical protein